MSEVDREGAKWMHCHGPFFFGNIFVVHKWVMLLLKRRQGGCIVVTFLFFPTT